MMKLKNTLLAVGAAACMWACQDAPVQESAGRYEEFTREFVKEFGAEALGRHWSDASQTTLELKSEEAMPVQVLYTDGDKLCLVGDITIGAGANKVPFIVPQDVKELIVETPRGHATVPIGSTLDLSTIEAAAKAPQRAAEDPDRYPIERAIRFKSDELLKIWNDAVPLGANNLYLDENKIFSYLSDFSSVDKFWTYLVYYDFRSELGKNIDRSLISFGGHGVDDPWHPLKNVYFSNGHDLYNRADYDDGRNLINMSGSPFAVTHSQYCTVQTLGDEGISRYNYYDTPYDTFTYNTGLKDKEFYGKIGKENWWTGYRYWNTRIGYISRAHAGSVIYAPEEPVTYKVYRDGKWVERTRKALFIGVSLPALENKWPYNGKHYGLGCEIAPDFNSMVFMAVPEEADGAVGFSYSHATARSSSNFLIAAEDLGGTFDWDFNDAVFEVKCVTRNISDIILNKFGMNQEMDSYPNIFSEGWHHEYTIEYTVTPLAAGGVMPLYVAYHGEVADCSAAAAIIEGTDANTMFNDVAKRMIEFNNNPDNWRDGTWVVGAEMHNWLGSPDTDVMINTGEKVTHHGRPVRFYARTIDYNNGTLSSENRPLADFSVIVDRKKDLGIDTSAAFNPAGEGTADDALTGFSGVLGQNGYEIGAVTADNNSQATMMLCMSTGWQWPREWEHINSAYNGFRPWITGQITWWENRNKPSDPSKVTKR